MTTTINNVTLSGRLVRQVELRHTQQGKALAKGSIAWNKKGKKVGDEWQDGDPQYCDFTAWEGVAEAMADLKVGELILVTGRLEYETWEGKDGGKRTRLGIVVETFGPMPDKRKTERRAPAKAAKPADDTYDPNEIPF